MTTRSGRSSATGLASHKAPQEALADLVQQMEFANYYPELVFDTLRLATGEEEILSGMVRPETAFAEAVHRHLTVLTLTPSRFIIVHVDNTPRDGGSPDALTTNKTIPLGRVRSMAPTHGVADPARGGGALTEMTIAASWGSVHRIDMEPATCDDPDYQVDHSMTSVSVPDGVIIHMAAGVEGTAALTRAETFVGRPSQMAARTIAL